MTIDYKTRNKKVSISQVNFYDIFQFYKKEIIPYKFTYFLSNGSIIDLEFEESNFSHLIGVHKLYKAKKPLEIINEILNKKITIGNVKKIYGEIKPELKDRFMYFPCLYHILLNSAEILIFDSKKCMPTKLKASFLLIAGDIAVTVYVAIKNIDENSGTIRCVGVSFIVDRVDKYQKEKQDKLEIINLPMQQR
ncbi:PBECR4 domain-containing protein [Fusobacterium necrophorum]|uniref:PBECR4 domain-containing protein n=1 Tax=Fusobacterium necrophorum TaxID=859 RepID=UPI00254ECA65|nr:PBECR4 domain-containing protein [Fusobacterium necrophorum]MDK4514156.1 PBECR4 domain-containing protein [Fusobacterium necrophorum]